MPEIEESRDILIEVRSDLKHIREKVDHLVTSDIKQWEKLDDLSVKTEGHDKTLIFLGRGFWGGITALCGLGLAFLRGER